jgi:hypothetical protein
MQALWVMMQSVHHGTSLEPMGDEPMDDVMDDVMDEVVEYIVSPAVATHPLSLPHSHSHPTRTRPTQLVGKSRWSLPLKSERQIL